MKTTKCYRWVTDSMKSQNGNIQWVLNDWQKHKGNITMCEDGFHACETAKAVLKWRFGSRLFVAEGRGTTIKDSSKFQEMRLVKEVTDVKGLCVQFAVNCAKRVLINYEKQYLDDLKPRRAIEAAENWLEKRDAAASATAYAADAAYDAASYATDAAYDAASAAAYKNEKEWQEKHFLKLLEERLDS